MEALKGITSRRTIRDCHTLQMWGKLIEKDSGTGNAFHPPLHVAPRFLTGRASWPAPHRGGFVIWRSPSSRKKDKGKKWSTVEAGNEYRIVETRILFAFRDNEEDC
jgi:hypothetical protein